MQTAFYEMKAILVINMPEDCGKCRLADFGKCRGSKSYIHMPIKGRPKECPLRPLPQKKWHEEGKENECEEWYRNGWNDCLEEITGETE